MSNSESPRQEPGFEREHLDGLADGAGCAEIWTYLSENDDRTGRS